MHIFSNRPSTWQDLQNFVGKLFSEIGYAVEVSKVISLVRGNKEIDVFVQDTKSEYGTTFLIECKHWSKPVNQETVHAFHTIMNDAGANFYPKQNNLRNPRSLTAKKVKLWCCLNHFCKWKQQVVNVDDGKVSSGMRAQKATFYCSEIRGGKIGCYIIIVFHLSA